MTSITDYFWNSDLRTGSTSYAKPKLISTTYPTNPTWNNPGQITFQLAQQPDVRQFFLNKMTQFNNLAQPNLWEKAMHITESTAIGSPITQVIQQMDQTLLAEAQKNGTALQILSRLRSELNTSNFNGFPQLANASGLIQTFQSLLSGGGIPGLNIQGMINNILSAFTSMGSQAISTGTAQNNATAINQSLNADGTPISATNSVQT